MALLAIDNLTKTFGGLKALKDVSLSLNEGQIKSIIGPNGAGKTTLFNVISGFLLPECGAIHFSGRDITRLPAEVISQAGIARTFQVVKPFSNITVLENVLIGALHRDSSVKVARERAREVLKSIGMGDKLEWPARKLTLEDLKRLELGRALATQPRVLLLDEVMAGLNPSEVKEFIKLILRIRDGGVTVLLIEHIMHAVMSLSDEVFVLNYGEKIYEGDTVGVVKDRAVVEAYFGEDFLLT